VLFYWQAEVREERSALVQTGEFKRRRFTSFVPSPREVGVDGRYVWTRLRGPPASSSLDVQGRLCGFGYLFPASGYKLTHQRVHVSNPRNECAHVEHTMEQTIEPMHPDRDPG
jgi:hypothetical protein